MGEERERENNNLVWCRQAMVKERKVVCGRTLMVA